MNAYIDNLASVQVLRTNLENKPPLTRVPLPALILDTNVLLDMFYWDNTDAHRIAEELNHYTCLYAWETLIEYADILSRSQFALTPDDQIKLLKQITDTFAFCAITAHSPVRCKDSDDQKFLDLALSYAPAILISKDKRVLKAGRKMKKLGITALSVTEFVKRLENNS